MSGYRVGFPEHTVRCRQLREPESAMPKGEEVGGVVRGEGASATKFNSMDATASFTNSVPAVWPRCISRMT